MRKFLIGAALLGAVAAVSPASAQNYGRGYDRAEIHQIGQQIRMLDDRGRIEPRYAVQLHDEYRGLVRLSRRYQRDGLNWNERDDLQRRTYNLERKVRAYSRGGYGRGGYGRDDRYNRYDD